MAYLFFDIESFVDPENPDSGLNPFHPESKVLAISYAYYCSERPPEPAEIKETSFLFEWEIGSEKKLLKKFFDLLKKWSSGERYFKMVGFNHLGYDVPYLFARMLHHKIASEKELFSLLYTRVRHIDLSQISMPVSKFTKRDMDFRNISQKAINFAFSIPVKEDSGVDVSRYYSEKKYDKVKQYCREEFTFELLYQSLLQSFLH